MFHQSSSDLFFNLQYIIINVFPSPPHDFFQEQRCGIPSSYAKTIVRVMKDLQVVRQKSNVFQGKHGFITARDLLRWASRQPGSTQELAEEGYMLLAERLRKPDERAVVQEVLERQCKAKIDPSELYAKYFANEAGFLSDASKEMVASLEEKQTVTFSDAAPSTTSADETSVSSINVVYTKALRRLFVLVGRCLRHGEPVMLVGETGCGKTTICQLFAHLRQQQLRILNFHQHTETADIVGGLRPVRSREANQAALQAVCHRFLTMCPRPLPAMPDAVGEKTLDDPNASADDILDLFDGDLRRCDAYIQSVLRALQRQPSAGDDDVASSDARSSKAKRKASSPGTESPASEGGDSGGGGGGKARRTNRGRRAAKKIPEVPEAAEAAEAAAAVEESEALESKDDGAQPTKGSELLQELGELAADVARRARLLSALFEWANGPLVMAMQNGDLFLADELSLAEDAVIERLNSVLEPRGSLLLAEKAGANIELVEPHQHFRILATMNPGGDFGKKELSPALRNRFTEIWVPAIGDDEDMHRIISLRLQPYGLDALMPFASRLLAFTTWYNGTGSSGNGGAALKAGELTIRDILAWVSFMGSTTDDDEDGEDGEQNMDRGANLAPWHSYCHGACLVLLDGLGLGVGMSQAASADLRKRAVQFILDQAPPELQSRLTASMQCDLALMMAPEGDDEDLSTSTIKHDAQLVANRFSMGPFSVQCGGATQGRPASSYAFGAPTTARNLLRLLRAIQVSKPILLEGSPGVGKTSLVSALAAASGHTLVRINLSEHTDLSDLLGADLPVADADADGGGASFAWSDGVFLEALKKGHWVLLDEMNLAPQAVLEGLNACLDHRAAVYIPELDRTFACPSSFRVFAAQNPLHEGGGRKGLPKSFLNRFTKVYVDVLQFDDMVHIGSEVFPQLARPPASLSSFGASEEGSGVAPVVADLLPKMIKFTTAVQHDTMVTHLYGRAGSPWEFNLRDVFRWCELLVREQAGCDGNWQPAWHADLIFFSRMRTSADRVAMAKRFNELFAGEEELSASDAKEGDQQDASSRWLCPHLRSPRIHISDTVVQIGSSFLARDATRTTSHNNVHAGADGSMADIPIPRALLAPLEHVVKCVEHSWPCLLVGPPASGKTTVLRTMANLAGKELSEFPLSTSTDSTELLGCFEQSDTSRRVRQLVARVHAIVLRTRGILPSTQPGSGGSEQQSASAAHIESLESLSDDLGPYLNGSAELVSAQCVATLQQATSALDACFEECLAGRTTVGGEPVEVFEQIKSQVEALANEDLTKRNVGTFEWVDGLLVQAMEKGDWLVLENANLCSPTVLDRLNPVLEDGSDGGTLLINECGLVDGKPRIVHAHPGFRIFLVMDPSFGEISRAMRNRCVEVAFLPVPAGALPAPSDGATELVASPTASRSSEAAAGTGRDSRWFDALLVVRSTGLRGLDLCLFMVHVHGMVADDCAARSRRPTPRDLYRWGKSMQEAIGRGFDFIDALRWTFELTYDYFEYRGLRLVAARAALQHRGALAWVASPQSEDDILSDVHLAPAMPPASNVADLLVYNGLEYGIRGATSHMLHAVLCDGIASVLISAISEGDVNLWDKARNSPLASCMPASAIGGPFEQIDFTQATPLSSMLEYVLGCNELGHLGLPNDLRIDDGCKRSNSTLESGTPEWLLPALKLFFRDASLADWKNRVEWLDAFKQTILAGANAIVEIHDGIEIITKTIQRASHAAETVFTSPLAIHLAEQETLIARYCADAGDESKQRGANPPVDASPMRANNNVDRRVRMQYRYREAVAHTDGSEHTTVENADERWGVYVLMQDALGLLFDVVWQSDSEAVVYDTRPAWFVQSVLAVSFDQKHGHGAARQLDGWHALVQPLFVAFDECMQVRHWGRCVC